MNMFGEVYEKYDYWQQQKNVAILNQVKCLKGQIPDQLNMYQKVKVRNKYSYKSGAIFHGSFIGLWWRLIEAYSSTASTLPTISLKKNSAHEIGNFQTSETLGKVEKSFSNYAGEVGVLFRFVST